MPRMPMPSAALRETGSFRDDKHGARLDVQMAPAGMPSMPDDFNDEQQRLWHRVLASLPQGVVGELDESSLVELCRVWRLMSETGRKLIEDPTDQKTRCAYRDYHDRFMKWVKEFGLSPASRASIKLQSDVGEEDPMDEILQRMAGGDGGVVGKLR